MMPAVNAVHKLSTPVFFSRCVGTQNAKSVDLSQFSCDIINANYVVSDSSCMLSSVS